MSETPRDGQSVLRLLGIAGLRTYVEQLRVDEHCVKGPILAGLLPQLIAHMDASEDFYRCPWHGLHAVDVGPNRVSWRSYRGAFGEDCDGSMQVVVGQDWRRFYADIDIANTQDVVNIVEHLGGEVAAPTLRTFVRKAWTLVSMLRKDRAKQQVDV